MSGRRSREKPGATEAMRFVSSISELDDLEVRVRGYPLDALIRRRGFADNVYLTLRGELPGEQHAAVFEAVLSSLMSYTAAGGPNILAGRIAASVRPDPWVGIATALSCAGRTRSRRSTPEP